MPPAMLKSTTMDPAKRELIQVSLEEGDQTAQQMIDRLMGRRPESRFQYIQESAHLITADD
jgi:topoisomerase-4 subunit B